MVVGAVLPTFLHLPQNQVLPLLMLLNSFSGADYRCNALTKYLLVIVLIIIPCNWVIFCLIPSICF